MQTAYRNRPFPPPAFPQRTDTQRHARSTSRPRNDDRGYATDNYSYTPRSNYDNSYINTSSQSQRGGNYSRHANSATVNSYTTSTSGQRPNHVRQQQSLASFPSQPSSSRAHHSHSNSEVPMRPPPNRGYNQPNPPFSMTSRRTPSLTSSNTASSTSSANSSFLERMKPGSGNSTSRTSFETDAGGNSPHNTSSNRKLWNDGDAEAGPGVPSRSDGYSGYGYTIWNRITEAASNLTVNVNMAWAANIVSHSGEVTPPGAESRLTRAMKAYHLERAKSKSDLPSWLFDEHERRSAPVKEENVRDEWGRVIEKGGREMSYDDGGEYERGREAGARGRGLRDVYDTAVVSNNDRDHDQNDRRRGISLRQGSIDYGGDRGGSVTTSKALDRLKAIRDAKKQALGVGRERDRDKENEDREERYERGDRGNVRDRDGSYRLQQERNNMAMRNRAKSAGPGPGSRNRDRDGSASDYERDNGGGRPSRAAPSLPRGPRQGFSQIPTRDRDRGLPLPPPPARAPPPRQPMVRSRTRSQGQIQVTRNGSSDAYGSSSQGRSIGGGERGRGLTTPNESFGGGGSRNLRRRG